MQFINLFVYHYNYRIIVPDNKIKKNRIRNKIKLDLRINQIDKKKKQKKNKKKQKKQKKKNKKTKNKKQKKVIIKTIIY